MSTYMNLIKDCAAIFLGVFASILLVEVVLLVANFPSSHQIAETFADVEESEWWKCKNGICRFNKFGVDQFYEVNRDRSKNFELRLSVINSEGFHDADEFVDPQIPLVAFLGDSFTWGATTTHLGNSYVEVFESEVKDINLVYNFGVPATGTKQALAIAKRYLAELKPSLVVLGFCLDNDFSDNRFPNDYFYRTNTGQAVAKYFYDIFSLNYVAYDFEAAHAAIHAYSLSEFWGWSRLVPLLKKFYYMMLNKLGSLAEEKSEIQNTYELLLQLNQQIVGNGGSMVVMFIPEKREVDENGYSPSRNYTVLKKLLSEKNIETFTPLVDSKFYQNEHESDNHWNDLGHKSVGQQLKSFLTSQEKESKSLN